MNTENNAEKTDRGDLIQRSINDSLDLGLKLDNGALDKNRSIYLADGMTLELVWCSPGCFTMGSPSTELGRQDDERQHQVTLTKGFWIGKYEVTQRQWETVMGNNPSSFKTAGPDAPVESVSWVDCQEFIRRLNFCVSGGGFRLPTEAEWEFASRGGMMSQGYMYSGGNDLDRVGWWGLHAITISHMNNNTSGNTTHPVGQMVPNELGLYDMSGNVWEWCQDWYDDYPKGNVVDPAGGDSGSGRVSRGGCWEIAAKHCRSASRGHDNPQFCRNETGLRLVRTLNCP